jgi:hypothetical protein
MQMTKTYWCHIIYVTFESTGVTGNKSQNSYAKRNHVTAGPSGSAVRGVGLDLLDVEVVGSNPTYGCLSLSFCVVLCR